MEVLEIRRTNLKALSDRYGSQRALADALDESPSYVNQLIKGRRDISEATARNFEGKLGLGHNAMDFKELKNMLKFPGDNLKDCGKVTFKGLKTIYGIDSDNVRDAIMTLLGIMTDIDQDGKLARAIDLLELARLELKQAKDSAVGQKENEISG